MNKTAIMVDGGFFHKRVNVLWGTNDSGSERATRLHEYCLNHLSCRDEKSELYRVFYYDCPPVKDNVYHPILRKSIYLGRTHLYKWMTEFHKELTRKRKVAMRMGELSGCQYTLRPEAVKKLFRGDLQLNSLTEADFILDIKQKGVDMKLGIDILSIALKRQVSQIVLISGDSDFVPAAKAARREGIDFILDPMGSHIGHDLQEHIDGLRSIASKPEPDNGTAVPYDH